MRSLNVEPFLSKVILKYDMDNIQLLTKVDIVACCLILYVVYNKPWSHCFWCYTGCDGSVVVSGLCRAAEASSSSAVEEAGIYAGGSTSSTWLFLLLHHSSSCIGSLSESWDFIGESEQTHCEWFQVHIVRLRNDFRSLLHHYRKQTGWFVRQKACTHYISLHLFSYAVNVCVKSSMDNLSV